MITIAYRSGRPTGPHQSPYQHHRQPQLASRPVSDPVCWPGFSAGIGDVSRTPAGRSSRSCSRSGAVPAATPTRAPVNHSDPAADHQAEAAAGQPHRAGLSPHLLATSSHRPAATMSSQSVSPPSSSCHPLATGGPVSHAESAAGQLLRAVRPSATVNRQPGDPLSWQPVSATG